MIHLGKEDNLRMKHTTIPRAGFGLFSYKKTFNHNAHLDYYTGRRTNPRKLDRIYGGMTAPYTICLNQSKNAICIDTNQSTDGALRFSIDARCRQQTNIGIFPKRNRKIYFKGKTLKNIPPHTELFNAYRKEYWKNYAIPYSKSKYYIKK